MREMGLRARTKRSFKASTNSTHGFAVAPNLLNRDFSADSRDRAWVGDVTAIRTQDGWIYLAVLLDLFSRRVVGWSTSKSNDTKLALEALFSATKTRKPGSGLIHHTDRGSPYASDAYREATAKAGMRTSMSRKGDCWDNAVSEAFFKTLRAELITDLGVASEGMIRRQIHAYIEDFYNPVRRHSYLGYISPLEFEIRCAAWQQPA